MIKVSLFDLYLFPNISQKILHLNTLSVLAGQAAKQIQKYDPVVKIGIRFFSGSNDYSNSISYVNRVKRSIGKTAAVPACGSYPVQCAVVM